MIKNNPLNAELIKTLVTQIQKGAAIVNADSMVVEICNQRFAEILKVDQNLTVGQRISKFIPGFRVGNPGKEETYILPSCEKINAEIIPINDGENGTVILVNVSPVSQQKQEKITKAAFLNRAFKTILDNIDEGILVVDEAGKIVYCNQVQLDFDGFKFVDIVGRYTWDVYNFEQDLSTLKKCLDDNKPHGNYVHYYISNHGQYVRVTGNNFPVKHKNRSLGAVAIYRNLRKSEEMACKIVELQKKLSECHGEMENGLVNTSKKGKQYYTFGDILGKSHSLKESLRWAKCAAGSDSPVFLYGETGTGKEMYAQSIHHSSDRGKKPLVSVNCAAIPESLLEGIIFGTVKGAFTGSTDRKGLFEEADGGTIFLDEINSMPINLQGKLLRALEEQKIRRLGGKSEIPVDVRIISCCNVHPSEAIRQKILRSDLFYRLAVINIEIPPLRKRKEDIRILMEFFVDSYNAGLGKNIGIISPELFAMAEVYDWPGNVRQLKHWVESAMNMVPVDEQILNKKHVPQGFNSFMGNVLKDQDKPKKNEVFTEIRQNECQKIIKALKKQRGNISRTALDLGISRQVLYYRMKKHGIK